MNIPDLLTLGNMRIKLRSNRVRTPQPLIEIVPPLGGMRVISGYAEFAKVGGTDEGAATEAIDQSPVLTEQTGPHR